MKLQNVGSGTEFLGIRKDWIILHNKTIAPGDYSTLRKQHEIASPYAASDDSPFYQVPAGKKLVIFGYRGLTKNASTTSYTTKVLFGYSDAAKEGTASHTGVTASGIAYALSVGTGAPCSLDIADVKLTYSAPIPAGMYPVLRGIGEQVYIKEAFCYLEDA